MLHHIELLVLYTVIHAIVIALAVQHAIAFGLTTTIQITMWAAIGLLVLHYIKLLASTVGKLTHP